MHVGYEGCRLHVGLGTMEQALAEVRHVVHRAYGARRVFYVVG